MEILDGMVLVPEMDYGDYNVSESGSGEWGEFSAEPCRDAPNVDFIRIFLPTVFGAIFVLGAVGNGLVVAVMGFQKKSRTMTDKYRLHLSLADLLFVFTLPFWATDAASSWYFGNFLCVAVHMIYTVNLYSSVLILAFISLDRYLAVVHATNSQRPRRILAERVIYVGVWLPAVLFTVPDLFFAKARVGSNKTTCGRIYPHETRYIWQAVFQFQHIFVGFVIPGLIILTCYCIIISKLYQGSKVQLKRKALKTTVILILCFFTCWLPYCICIFVHTLVILNIFPRNCSLEQNLLTWIAVTEALAFFHCCLNPILYAFLGVKFKKSARTAFANSQGSSLKMLKKRAGLSSISTESESSSFHSS